MTIEDDRMHLSPEGVSARVSQPCRHAWGFAADGRDVCVYCGSGRIGPLGVPGWKPEPFDYPEAPLMEQRDGKPNPLGVPGYAGVPQAHDVDHGPDCEVCEAQVLRGRSMTDAQSAAVGLPRVSNVPTAVPEATLVDRLAGLNAWTLAGWFHEAYEQAAPLYGYETRPESRVHFDDIPQNNRLTMVATAQAILDRLAFPEVLAALRAAQERDRAVTALHPEEVNDEDRPWCMTCGTYWPCDTLRALAASPDQEAGR